VSVANHNLNRLLDKPGNLYRKYLFGVELPDQAEVTGLVLCFGKNNFCQRISGKNMASEVRNVVFCTQISITE
jgi:hypothetical protein